MNDPDQTVDLPQQMTTKDENELICEKLLGWVRECRESEPGWIEELFWRLSDGTRESETPTFTTWAEAGLILEALQRLVNSPHWQAGEALLGKLGGVLINGQFTPTAIRAAALVYLGAQK